MRLTSTSVFYFPAGDAISTCRRIDRRSAYSCISTAWELGQHVQLLGKRYLLVEVASSCATRAGGPWLPATSCLVVSRLYAGFSAGWATSVLGRVDGALKDSAPFDLRGHHSPWHIIRAPTLRIGQLDTHAHDVASASAARCRVQRVG